jgi:hypothetical protein
LKSNSCFRGERNKAFTVRHYAGEVWIWSRSYNVICEIYFQNIYTSFCLSIVLVNNCLKIWIVLRFTLQWLSSCILVRAL